MRCAEAMSPAPPKNIAVLVTTITDNESSRFASRTHRRASGRQDLAAALSFALPMPDKRAPARERQRQRERDRERERERKRGTRGKQADVKSDMRESKQERRKAEREMTGMIGML